ncbi:MAG: glycosyltransferase family 2 protein, partial [Oscillospiraceae bacterium]|nr:glycosyltransferase family 2 protein [Oscillospiraceae bacterium]
MSLETDIYTSTLYTDMATGLGDTALEQKQYVLDKTTCSAHLEFQIPTGAIRLCFHPLDNGGTCIIKNLHISDESGQLPYSALGGEPMGEYRIFSAESPRFSITPSHSSKVLQIDLQIYPMEETVLQACLEQFDHLQDTAREAQHNADNYRRQNEASSIQLQAIQRSFFWRLTKPLRAVSGGIKKVMRSSRFMRLIYHGLASIRHFGIRATCSRILFKLTKGRRGRNPIIGNPLLQNVYGHPAIPEDILFSIIVPLYNTPEVYLAALINSIKAQVYTNWELCLADGSEQGQDLKSFVSRCAAGDARIKYKRLEKNQGISGNSNEALAMAQGDFIVLADHDDLLSPDALYENAVAVYETSADVLYSDEDHVDEQGNHFFPFFKPDWSPDLLYAQMYICHLLVIRKSTFYKAGIFDSAYDGSQDYDLMLRLSEITDCIYHIPQVLYSWRETKGSTSVDASAKPYAQDAGLRALNAHLSRKYGSLAKAFDSEYLFVYDTRFYTMQNQPLVSIIIPMKDHWEMTRDCVASILKSSYRHFEIILINNNSELPDSLQWLEQIGVTDERIHVIDAAFSFNWSKLNNWGMKHAKGDVFVFLNNDIIVDSNDWLERLCENALRDEIGAVGCLLRYENGTIQHAGVGLGLGGWADHIFKGMRPEHFGSPYVSPMVNRNVLAVTGACLAVSRKTVEKIGAFDESFIICGSDVEFCLRAYRHGFFNLYDARVTLFHLESKSRDSYIPDEDFKRSAESYAFYLENGDPFLNLNLDLSSTSPRQDSEGKSATIDRFQNYLQKHPGQKQKTNPSRIINPLSFAPFIAEVNPMEARESAVLGDDKRLNLLIPSLNTEGVFGGIATALSFFQALLNKMGPEIKARVIVLDAALDKRHRVSMPGYVIHAWNEDSADSRQIVDFF